ncbi:fasciclin-like arabinogalactan protein 19 [Typha angustifolia]|uniref:fasciclin-like arabinogalactan protein 19 n=1 Tax=Typha angustifolia TaxID=59011 RepID=UPI003C2E0BC1
MAKLNPLLLLLLLSFTFFSTTTSVSDLELSAAISALRLRGYTLFGNAITASDVRFDLLSSSNSSAFTLFAPTDASLFSLDMASSAFSYVRSLRSHVALGHFPFNALLSLDSPLPTLLSNRQIYISRRSGIGGGGSEVLTANGVEIAIPGVYDGPDLAVHGLAGILSTSLRRQIPIPPTRSLEMIFPPVNQPDLWSPASSPYPNSPAPEMISIFPPVAPPPSDLVWFRPAVPPRIGAEEISPIVSEIAFPPGGISPSSPAPSPEGMMGISWKGGVRVEEETNVCAGDQDGCYHVIAGRSGSSDRSVATSEGGF